MKHLLTASTICSTLLFFCCAVPGRAEVITFSSSTPGGDLTTATPTGNPDLVTGIGFPTPDTLETIDTLTISGDGAANGTYTVFLQEMYNGTTDTLTVFGTITTVPQLPGLLTTSNLATIQLSSAGLSANATPTSVNVLFPTNVVSITLGSAFAADLGLPTSLPTGDLTALTDTGPEVIAGGGNYDITSASLVLTTSTPEPGSWMLITSGLALMLFAARKRFPKGTR